MAKGVSKSSLLWQRFIVQVAHASMKNIQAKPRKQVIRLGKSWGRAGYKLVAKSRRDARRNVYLAYPTLAESAREVIVKERFEHFAAMMFEFIKAPVYTPEEVIGLADLEPGTEETIHALMQLDTGVITVIPHLGNFEFLARWTGCRGYDMTAVVREPDDPAFAGLVDELRAGCNYKVVNKGNAFRPLLRALSNRGAVGILPDQNSGDCFVPFFGMPAGTVLGPAKLAVATGAPIMPLFCTREPDDRYRLWFGDQITPAPDARSLGESELLRLTREINIELEKGIRRVPGQYLWMHNRFKSAFEEKNRALWPADIDVEGVTARWETSRSIK
jgi:KDO2-lipid IV(A) lauroyltransferase